MQAIVGMRVDRPNSTEWCFMTRGGVLATWVLVWLAVLTAAGYAQDATPAEAEATPMPVPFVKPPADAQAVDTPSDGGGSITVRIVPSPDEKNASDPVIAYHVERAVCEPRNFALLGMTSAWALQPQSGHSRDKPELAVLDSDCRDGVNYYYRVVAVTQSGRRSGAITLGPVKATAQWFAADKLNLLVLGLIVSLAILFFIEAIRRGKKPFIRRIAGLDAVDEAIGRATEMGRPILFVPGINDMNDVQTVSAIIILGRLARTIAEYDTRLMMPNTRSLVMVAARETVKEAYIAAGRADSYNDEMITYLTDEQFGYAAGVSGLMVREKPATCLYLGAFFAESLFLAETGNHIGAIQIAGTANPDQLPFFIAACDYTLLGEELFAASAYLSHEPKQLGSLKGQDVGKAIAMLVILVGSLLLTAATLTGSDTMWKIADFVHGLFRVAT
jgi:hypothetical protein